MPTSSPSSILKNLVQLSVPLKESLSRTPYTPLESCPDVSIKSQLLSLLLDSDISEPHIGTKFNNFIMCCAALASASESTTQYLSWIPKSLSDFAISAFKEIAKSYYDDAMNTKCLMKDSEMDLDLSGVVKNEIKLVIKLIPEVFPLLKDNIKESATDATDENDGISAASSRVPVAYAILAAYQFRWFVTQVDSSYLGKVSSFVIPCALTALDHWSSQVKGQGMITFIHFAKKVNSTDFGGYTDVILDACCQNIASDDEIWHLVVEMSVLLVTSTQIGNPRSLWYEKLFTEMLNHLERQPRNKQRCSAWLRHSEKLFDALGLVLLANFRRLFPLFFKWMHSDDDEIVLLVLERIITVVRLTWIRNSPFLGRLVDELVALYKDAALKVAREDIRSLILRILNLIWLCKPQLFDATWAKYKDDPNLIAVLPSIVDRDPTMVA